MRIRGAHRLVGVLLVGLLAGSCTGIKRCAYEGGDRDAWQQPARVIEVLGIEPGQTVADLGAGSGYFTGRLAAAVGPEGRVYAADVDAAMNESLAERMREEGHANVAIVLAGLDDPNLPEPVDLIFTSNTYHHLEDRSAYFANAARQLRPGGRVAILEYRRYGWFQRWFGHFTSAETIESEMAAAGYRPVARFDFLERQNFLVFAH